MSKRSQICHKKTRDEKLSSRWEKLAIDVSRALPAGVRAIHIMDQEADDYALLAALQEAKLSFVVRGAVDRVLWHHGPSVADALSTKPAKVFRSIRVGARSKKAATQSHPARAERKAKLSLRWGAVTIRRGGPLVQSDVKELRVFAVHVCEMTPPTGEPAIEWMLFTTEAVETLADATAIVDHYRARWIIEEYFKALKTGCAFEKRQLTTRDGLERALGLFAPAAWKLLTLRYLGRLTKRRPASRVFTDEQLVLLRMLLKKRNGSLPASPTIRDAMFGIAASRHSVATS